MSTSENSLISVIMGVYYRQHDITYLMRSVESILQQTYVNFEFLICDDGSTENAMQYLSDCERKDERIRLIRGVPRTDLASKLNACIRMSCGQYIARMDDDDYSYPHRFEEQLLYLQAHNDVAFVGCITDLVRNNQSVGIRYLPPEPNVRDFVFVQPFIHPSLMFRRSVLLQTDGYSELPRCCGCEDYDLLLRIYQQKMHGVNIQTPLMTYTLPPSGSRKRTFHLRWNEVKTRLACFRQLHLLPGALPYVLKPVVVGCLPQRCIERLQQYRAKCRAHKFTRE